MQPIAHFIFHRKDFISFVMGQRSNMKKPSPFKIQFVRALRAQNSSSIRRMLSNSLVSCFQDLTGNYKVCYPRVFGCLTDEPTFSFYNWKLYRRYFFPHRNFLRKSFWPFKEMTVSTLPGFTNNIENRRIAEPNRLNSKGFVDERRMGRICIQ